MANTQNRFTTKSIFNKINSYKIMWTNIFFIAWSDELPNTFTILCSTSLMMDLTLLPACRFLFRLPCYLDQAAWWRAVQPSRQTSTYYIMMKLRSLFFHFDSTLYECSSFIFCSEKWSNFLININIIVVLYFSYSKLID